MTKRERAAMNIAIASSHVEGEHHLRWIIDQMLRALMGLEEYEKFIEEYETSFTDSDGERLCNEWDKGIAS